MSLLNQYILLLIISPQQYIIFSLFYSVDIDMVYSLQKTKHRCRFDNDFELRWAEEPTFWIEESLGSVGYLDVARDFQYYLLRWNASDWYE